MFNTTIDILGPRLQQIREHLQKSQDELAELFNCNQNAISYIETGKGGNISLLVQLLGYYSQYVYLNSLFSENFHLITINEKDSALLPNYNSVITKLLDDAQTDYIKSREEIKEETEKKEKIIEQEYKSRIERIKDLL